MYYGPEFRSRVVRGWLKDLGGEALFIEPGSPWENGYCESFNGKLRDELLSREAFCTLEETREMSENWRREYNAVRSHDSLGYSLPAAEALAVVAGKGLDQLEKWTEHRWRGTERGSAG
jgi:transposase InsO family protein